MPHLVILYTPQLDKETDMDVLCRSLANTMLAARDENGAHQFFRLVVRVYWLFPPHISRWQMTAALAVLPEARATTPLFICNCVWPTAEQLPRTRSVGDALLQTTQTHFANIFDKRHIGITLQIDEGLTVYDGKHSNLHPLFTKA
jgi:5-carboxymethyl-2-hydroxymuconate isomerase